MFAPRTAKSGPGIPNGGTVLPKGGLRAVPYQEKSGEVLPGPELLRGLGEDDDAALIERFKLTPGLVLPPLDELGTPLGFAGGHRVGTAHHAKVGINAPKIGLSESVDEGKDCVDEDGPFAGVNGLLQRGYGGIALVSSGQPVGLHQ